jgi:hypothetical protein
MSTDRIKRQRTLPREILFFFGGLVLIGVVWGLLVLRNSFYHSKANSCLENIRVGQIKLDSLPKDYIKKIYEQVNKYFAVNYRVGADSYAIRKEWQQEFLDRYSIKRKVTELPIYSLGYSYFYIPGLEMFRKYGVVLIDPRRSSHGIDSAVVFDFVTLEKFRELIKSNDYQENLFRVFSIRLNQFRKQTDNSPINTSGFDPTIPYNGVFELGTAIEFRSKIQKGLRYNSNVVKEKNKILSDIRNQQELLAESKKRVLAVTEIHNFLIKAIIALGLFLYPVRLSIFLILWALKTINKKM